MNRTAARADNDATCFLRTDYERDQNRACNHRLYNRQDLSNCSHQRETVTDLVIKHLWVAL